MVSQARNKANGASLLKSRLPPEGRALVTRTNPSFALELYALVSALWSLEGSAPGALVVIHIDNVSAAQVSAKEGPLARSSIALPWRFGSGRLVTV